MSDWKECKTPSHEDIMTKWWKIDEYRWVKFSLFFPNETHQYGVYVADRYGDSYLFLYSKEMLINIQFADIPPES